MSLARAKWPGVFSVIKEGTNAIKWTRLSCLKFGFPPAYANATTRFGSSFMPWPTTAATSMRTLTLPKEVEHWSLTTPREKSVMIGAKVVHHGRYVTFQLA